jgi:hypothetical protein
LVALQTKIEERARKTTIDFWISRRGMSGKFHSTLGGVGLALGWMKLNTDGALNLQDGVAGAGIVARDNTGNFVTAECRRYDHISDPSTVEMLACRDAVMLAL